MLKFPIYFFYLDIVCILAISNNKIMSTTEIKLHLNMSNGLDFQIGEKVKWQINRIHATGCFLEDNNDGTCAIVVHTIAGQPATRIVNVKRELLELDI